MLILRNILMTSIGLMALTVGSEVKVVAIDTEMLPREQRANHQQRDQQTKVALRGWKKPGRRWPGRLY